MIRNDEELHRAQENIRKLENFLAAARQVHPPTEYRRMSEPFLLELQERQREVLKYLNQVEVLTEAVAG
jgi:hypothetical protein